jgi:hypothetical protein
MQRERVKFLYTRLIRVFFGREKREEREGEEDGEEINTGMSYGTTQSCKCKE